MIWYTSSFFNIFLFGMIVLLMATMDYYNFKKPHDSGFWSLKTKYPRNDVWHYSKRVILFIIAYIIIGPDQLIQILENQYFQFTAIAYFGQKLFYNKRR